MAGWRAGLAGFGIALGAAAGCYSPTLRDCTISCESAGDCASGQTCGADKLCAAPDTAGKCAELIDAGVLDGSAASHIDAGVVDALPTTVVIHVQIDGKGSVTLDNYGACGSQGAQHGDCTFTVAARTAQTIRVNLFPIGDPFVSWTSTTCKDAGAVCSFTPSVATTVVAKFDKPGGPK